MPRLKMIDAGLPYKKIMQGSKWVGRVYKNADGGYTGQIGKAPNRIEATGTTERQAFSEVSARFFGMENAAALAAHNAEVRANNRAMRPPRRRSLDGRSNDFLDQIARTLGLRSGSARVASVGTPGGERAVRLTGEPAPTERGEDEFVYRTNDRPVRPAILGNDFMPHGRRRR